MLYTCKDVDSEEEAINEHLNAFYGKTNKREKKDGKRKSGVFKSHFEKTGTGNSYMLGARRNSLNVGTMDLFFEEKAYVHTFGLSSLMFVRVGFDQVNNVSY